MICKFLFLGFLAAVETCNLHYTNWMTRVSFLSDVTDFRENDFLAIMEAELLFVLK